MPKKKEEFSNYEPVGSGQINAFAEKILKEWGCVVPGVKIAEYDNELRSISTGSTKLDWALTKPLKEGTINEIHGPKGTGKSTLSLEIAANANEMGKPVFYFDLERKLVNAQINMIPRIKRDLFFRVRPGTGEDAVNKVHECVTDVPGCVLIFDSLTALLPEVEDAEDAEKQSMGLVARLAAKMIRKILAPVERNRCMVLFISHETANLSMYSGEIKVKGGDAVPNAAAQRIRLKNLAAGRITDKDGNQIGQNVCCTVVKNNEGMPFRSVDVPLLFGKGINRNLDLLQISVDLGIVEKAGAWLNCEFGGQVKKYQGELAMLDAINTDEKFSEYLRCRVKELL